MALKRKPAFVEERPSDGEAGESASKRKRSEAAAPALPAGQTTLRGGKRAPKTPEAPAEAPPR